MNRFPAWQVKFCPFCGVSIVGRHQGNSAFRCPVCKDEFIVVAPNASVRYKLISGSLTDRLQDETITPADERLGRVEGPRIP